MRSRLGRLLLASAAIAGATTPSGSVVHAEELKVRCVVFLSTKESLTPEEFTAGIVDGSVRVVALEHSVECPTLDGAEPTPATVAPTPGATALPPIIEGDEYDVCFLVHDDEIEWVMHRKLMMPGFGTATGGLHNCAWSLYLDPAEMVMVTLSDAKDFDSVTLGQPRVEGLGDEAVWAFDASLFVRIVDRMLNVTVISETVDIKQASIDIARLAIPRLP